MRRSHVIHAALALLAPVLLHCARPSTGAPGAALGNAAATTADSPAPSASIPLNAELDASSLAAAEPGDATVTDSASSAPDAAGVTATLGRDAQLIIEHHPGYCGRANQAMEPCRSYSYVLAGDGTLRGGSRHAPVSARDVSELFEMASAALDDRRGCMEHPPDLAYFSMELRASGRTRRTGRCATAADRRVEQRMIGVAAQP